MPAPIDPDTLPLDAAFAADPGPAVDAEQLLPSALRRRFADPPPWQAEQASDGRLFRADRPQRSAAVLIALLPGSAGLEVAFTVRSASLHDHAGQISFPGGGVDADDATAVAAALREAHEEVDLSPERVEILGTLPDYLTVSGYRVTPVVALVAPGPPLRPHPGEVDEVFQVPLAFLADGASFQRRIVVQEASRRGVFAIEYHGARRYLIWGATAAMLRNFYRFLRA